MLWVGILNNKRASSLAECESCPVGKLYNTTSHTCSNCAAGAWSQAGSAVDTCPDGTCAHKECLLRDVTVVVCTRTHRRALGSVSHRCFVLRLRAISLPGRKVLYRWRTETVSNRNVFGCHWPLQCRPMHELRSGCMEQCRRNELLLGFVPFGCCMSRQNELEMISSDEVSFESCWGGGSTCIAG